MPWPVRGSGVGVLSFILPVVLQVQAMLPAPPVEQPILPPSMDAFD
jgi:hypothetical protein